jgi:hypothetical protein
MEHTHDPERCMNGFAFNPEMIMPADIIEKCRVGGSADRGNVQFHLNPSDTREIFRGYLPFSSFTIALQEITSSGHPDDFVERVGRRNNFAIIPPDFFWIPVTKRSLNDPERNTVQLDVLSEKRCRHRFNRDDVVRAAGCTDAERSYVCTDVNDTVIRAHIIEPVFRHFKDLPEYRILTEKSHLI